MFEIEVERPGPAVRVLTDLADPRLLDREHNAGAGGQEQSLHRLGYAFDIVLDDWDADWKEAAHFARRLGLAVLINKHKRYLHVQVPHVKDA